MNPVHDLFRVEHGIAELAALVADLPGGELSPEAAADLDDRFDREMARQGPALDGVYYVRASLDAGTETVKTEIKRLRDRIESLELQLHRLDALVLGHFARTGQQKVRTPAGRLFYTQANPTKAKLEIDVKRADDVLPRFRRVVTREEIDQQAITAAIQAGEPLDFARLVPTAPFHLRVK